MDAKIQIVIIDDHVMFREGVTSLLERDYSFAVIGQGASANEAVHLAATLMPDIILLDIDMPGNSFTAARKILSLSPKTRIIFLTVSESEDHLRKAIKAGACGYILKGITGRELSRILIEVFNGKSYIPPVFEEILALNENCMCC